MTGAVGANPIAIFLFLSFVVATLVITSFAARRSRSRAEFYTGWRPDCVRQRPGDRGQLHVRRRLPRRLGAGHHRRLRRHGVRHRLRHRAGAVAGGVTGLVSALGLTIVGPAIWVKVLGHAAPTFPYDPPAMVSVPLAFAVAWGVSMLTSGARPTLTPARSPALP